MSNTMWWYVMRSAGLTAWFFLTLTLVWGTLASGRLVPGAKAKRWIVDMHPYLGAVGLSALALHIVAAVSDSYVGLRWVNTVVPFTAGWRPWGVAFGVVSLWILVAVQGTSMMRKRLDKTTWHRIHLASYVGAWLTGVHAVMNGSDLGNPVIAWTAFALLATATVIASVRALKAPARTPAGRAPVAPTPPARRPEPVG
jgi:DMSO/TMAO reductase YedYZ heme-binding membrane subunit